MNRAPQLLSILLGLTVLVTAADHWTTYLCLRDPVPGWEVTEANPIAAWLFAALGLGPAILLDSAVTLVALGFVVNTVLVPLAVKHGFLMLVVTWTGWAVANNLNAIVQMGLSPLGGV